MFVGVRYVEIALDSQLVFKGEIRKAPGAVMSLEMNSECVLFTYDPLVLQLIEKYDKHIASIAVTPPSSSGGQGTGSSHGEV